MNQQNQDNSNIPKGGHPPQKKTNIDLLTSFECSDFS